MSSWVRLATARPRKPSWYHREGSSDLWVRPIAMWSEPVERDGYVGPRFVAVEKS
ncbi:MAG: DUF1653 domain-containing protein [Rhodoglobus sp.]